MAVDDVEKATVLNTFFAKQSSIDDSNHNITIDNADFNGIPLLSITIMQYEVYSILKTLKQGKSSGPDGINNRVLTEAAFQLAPILCSRFNQSLMSCTVRMSWKISNVCPIFKSGDKSLPCNYRPVSLPNGIEKVFERIIFKHVFNHLRQTEFFTPCHSGFLPGSTVNQVTYLYNSICKAIEDGLEINSGCILWHQ